METRHLLHYRRVSKLWDDTLEMTFLRRLSYDHWIEKRFIFNINWLETEEPAFTPFYNKMRLEFNKLLGLKEFAKKQNVIDFLQKRIRNVYKKEMHLILSIAVQQTTAFEHEEIDEVDKFLGTPEYIKQLDRLENL